MSNCCATFYHCIVENCTHVHDMSDDNDISSSSNTNNNKCERRTKERVQIERVDEEAVPYFISAHSFFANEWRALCMCDDVCVLFHSYLRSFRFDCYYYCCWVFVVFAIDALADTFGRLFCLWSRISRFCTLRNAISTYVYTVQKLPALVTHTQIYICVIVCVCVPYG